MKNKTEGLTMLEKREFFGSWNQENKAFWVAEMQNHQVADRLISGSWFYFDNETEFKGCFFGCAMQTDELPLEQAIDAMGLPAWLIYLAESIYEGLDDKERLGFPVTLLQSIPVGVNLTPVKHQLSVRRFENLCDKNPSVSNCLRAVIALHERAALGSDVLDSEWADAASAAWSAAASAAWSAAASAAYAAESAAESAESAAESAESARSAAESASWSAESAESAAESAESAAESARFGAWSAEAKNLISLLLQAQ